MRISWRWWLPRDAGPIQTEWPIKEGGLRAYAWTDRKRRVYIAVQTLNRIGKATGIPTWHRCDYYLADIVAGFVDERPLTVRVQVQATAAGLKMIVRLPPEIKKLKNFIERRFSPWDSDYPSLALTLVPTIDHYAVNSFPTE